MLHVLLDCDASLAVWPWKKKKKSQSIFFEVAFSNAQNATNLFFPLIAGKPH